MPLIARKSPASKATQTILFPGDILKLKAEIKKGKKQY
jgi:hypothetical protein